jgi:hypothetical protein
MVPRGTGVSWERRSPGEGMAYSAWSNSQSCAACRSGCLPASGRAASPTMPILCKPLLSSPSGATPPLLPDGKGDRLHLRFQRFAHRAATSFRSPPLLQAVNNGRRSRSGFPHFSGPSLPSLAERPQSSFRRALAALLRAAASVFPR